MTAVCGKRKQIRETKVRILSGNIRQSSRPEQLLLFTVFPKQISVMCDYASLLKICTAGRNNDLSCTESKHLDILFPECVINISLTDGENVLLMTSLPVQM